MELANLATDRRTRKATQVHYILYDNPPDERRVVAIHRVYESAEKCFEHLVKDGEFTRVLQLWRIFTNEFGYVTKEEPLYTYSKHLKRVITHTTIATPLQISC